jgi:hypothetical protein
MNRLKFCSGKEFPVFARRKLAGRMPDERDSLAKPTLIGAWMSF